MSGLNSFLNESEKDLIILMTDWTKYSSGWLTRSRCLLSPTNGRIYLYFQQCYITKGDFIIVSVSTSANSL